MRRHRASQAVFALLLACYPAEFRERFGDDLRADFADLLAQRGLRAAWTRAIADWWRALRLTHATARAAASRRLFTHPPGESVMGSLLFDLRHAVRALARTPVFTAVTIVTLALGIGANSAIFSLVNAVLIRPIGYERPDRLMLISESIPELGLARLGVSPPDVIDLMDSQQSFSALGAYRVRPFELSGGGVAEQVRAAQVTPQVMGMLGVPAALGRTLVPADGDASRLAVLGHGLWQRRFAGAGDVIGTRITLDRQPYTVVGVMPATFEFPKRGPAWNGEPADLWLPLVFNPFERQARGMMYTHSVIGRVKDGISLDQAAADTAALAPRIREKYPPALRDSPATLEVSARPLADEITGQVRRPLLLLLGAVGLVLFVACANVANLFLTRAVTRTREIGLRVALGAERRRLFQMLVIESLLLAAIAGAVGLLAGQWAVGAMPAAVASSLPGIGQVVLDARVVIFTIALSAGTAILFGLVPLAAGARRDVHDLLREGAARVTGGARQQRVQGSLVVASVALACVLLTGAGRLVQSFTRLLAVDPGLRQDHVLTLKVALPYAGYNTASAVRGFYRTLHDRLSALPGVHSATLSSDLPLHPDGERRAFWPERSGEPGSLPPSVAVTWIYGDYFATYGIPTLRGRTLTPEEEIENREVALVSHNLAARFWPDEDPIGKRLKWGFAVSPAPWKTVVGIAGNVVDDVPGSDPLIHVYVPYAEFPDGALSAPTAGYARTFTIGLRGAETASLAPAARAVIADLDPALAVTDVQTLAQVVRTATAPQRFSATAVTVFALGSLLMAAIGLYGVLAFAVSQRTREIGVRLALGATAREVVRHVLGRGMRLAALGLVIGLAGALAAVRVIGAQLYETDVYDPTTFVAVPLVLAAVSLLACYLPARRAAAVDPIQALRAE